MLAEQAREGGCRAALLQRLEPVAGELLLQDAAVPLGELAAEQHVDQLEPRRVHQCVAADLYSRTTSGYLVQSRAISCIRALLPT